MVNTTLNIEATDIFIKIARKFIKDNKFILVNRRDIDIGIRRVDTVEALLDLGITKSAAKEIIYDLSSSDCIRISFDYDKSKDENSEIFEFWKDINNIKAYIKLTTNGRGLICLAFHRSNQSKEY